MKVERIVAIYSIENDKLIGEIGIGEVPFELLKKIFNSKDNDPFLYMVYKINYEQFQMLSDLLPELTSIDVNDGVELYLECYQG